MQQLDFNLIKQARKNAGIETRKATLNLKKNTFPIDTNFICPYCSYVSFKNKQGSARIYSDKKLFVCFYCGEKRSVEL